ncbi:MAG TPA: YIP1 family protein [Bryobacteraceae bacterium]|nr:YIP1 family protein [Bryobacteraceae bacterium]
MEQPKLGVKEQNLTVGDGFIGMLNAFVDPAGTAKRVPAPLSWLWPVITLTIIYMVFGYLMLPYTMNLIDLRMNQQLSQQNAPVEQAERARNVAHMIYQFLPVATPVIVIVFLLLFAWLVSAMGSIAGLRAKFRDIFSLMAACSLIPALQTIATYIVLRAKGDEITSQEQLTPPFGLDIFMQDIHGALFALVNYFSIFQIWYLIVLTFGLAYLAKASKGKAFFAITPAWLLPLALRVIQGMFQGGQGG